MLLIVLWNEAVSTGYQATQARRFEEALKETPTTVLARTEAVAQVAAVAPAVSQNSIVQLWRAPGQGTTDPLLIGKLEIPRLGITVMIREGMESDTLRKAVGHMPGTAAPGQVGNFVVAGHRDTFFRPLRLVSDGDEIRVTTTAGSFHYYVTELSIVGPNDLRIAQSGSTAICTLVTCFPFGYIGPAPRRFVVRGGLRSRQTK
jgi:LPXTG-site transpeptidase (sortase) family protein